MKKITLLVLTYFLLSPIVHQAIAQTTVATINISTGHNPDTGGVMPDGANDPSWNIVQIPAGLGLGNIVGTPAVVIDNDGFDANHHDTNINVAKYIHVESNGDGLVDNMNESNTSPIIYERKFSIKGTYCEDTPPFLASFNLQLHADNWAEVFLVHPDNTAESLLRQHIDNSNNNGPNFRNPPDIASITIDNLVAGE